MLVSAGAASNLYSTPGGGGVGTFVLLKLLDYHRLRREEERAWDRPRLREEAGAEFVAAIESRLPRYTEPWRPDHLIHFTRDAQFEQCLELCGLYRGATPVQRTWVRSLMDRGLGGRLGLFGLRAAVLAAREHSAELARASLVAFAAIDLAEGDIRDTLIGFTLIVHCARLAGVDVPAMLRETAAIAGAAMRVLYEEWAADFPDVSGIGAMGWREVQAEEGVGFTTQFTR